jgi:hypothetical protein
MVPISFQIAGDGADNRFSPTSWAESYAGPAANALTYIKKPEIFCRAAKTATVGIVGLPEESERLKYGVI